MLKKIFVVSVLCVTLMALPVWALDLKPGKYEITATSQMEMPGMPEGMPGMPSQVSTQCITQQDPVPASSADAQGCEVTEMTTEGNTVTYTMTCEQQGQKITSSGNMTYKGDAFEGTNKTNAGQGMVITTTIKGTRIGKCD